MALPEYTCFINWHPPQRGRNSLVNTLSTINTPRWCEINAVINELRLVHSSQWAGCHPDRTDERYSTFCRYWSLWYRKPHTAAERSQTRFTIVALHHLRLLGCTGTTDNATSLYKQRFLLIHLNWQGKEQKEAGNTNARYYEAFRFYELKSSPLIKAHQIVNDNPTCLGIKSVLLHEISRRSVPHTIRLHLIQKRINVWMAQRAGIGAIQEALIFHYTSDTKDIFHFP